MRIKKILILSMTVVISLPSLALGLRIDKHYPINLPDASSAHHPQLSGDGSKLLYSTEDFDKLTLLDLSTNESVLIAEGNGVGNNPKFSQDGMDVYFNSAQTVKHLRYFKWESYNLGTKAITELSPLSRENLMLIPQKEGLTIKAGKSLRGVAPIMPIVASNYKTIIVTQNGKDKEINPIDDAHSYMWVSLSPDGSRIMFVEPYKGIFTCDLNGENLKSHGRGDNPLWFDNDFIVTMKTVDDGYVVLSSQLYAINTTTGSAIALTDESTRAEEATVAVDSHKIVYSTMDGKVFAIELTPID